jgi:hypothetical protein
VDVYSDVGLLRVMFESQKKVETSRRGDGVQGCLCSGLCIEDWAERGAMIVSKGGDAPPESSHVGATWKGLRRQRVVSGDIDMDTVMGMAFARADNSHSYKEHVGLVASHVCPPPPSCPPGTPSSL